MAEMFEQDTFNQILDQAAFGRLSPYEKAGREPLPRLATFPEEAISWVANVTVSRAMWGTESSQHTRSSGAIDTYVGVSPYRLVFFRETYSLTGNATQFCKSYWFDIDFEGWKWQRKKKHEFIYFTRVHMDRPEFKKKKIILRNLLTQNDGEVLDFFGAYDDCELYKIKWIDPESGKKVRRSEDRVYEQIIQAYDNQIPVKASELAFLLRGREHLEEYLASSEEQDAAASAAPAAKRGKVSKAPASARAKETPAAAQGSLTCGNCGYALQAEWKACPACGEPQPQRCQACGQELEPQWKVCPNCGAQTGA